MKKYKVGFTVEVPDEPTYADVVEWIRYELKHTSSLPESNPLSDTDLEGKGVIVILIGKQD